MANKVKLNGNYLPILAGITQAVLFAVASDIYFNRFYLGALAGLIPSLALAFGASRIAAIKSPGRRNMGYITMVLTMLLSPVVVSPALFLEIDLPPVLAWAVSIAWASLPDVAVVFAAVVAGVSLFSLEQTPSKPQETESEPPKRTKRKVAKSFACPCGKSFGSQNALNAHSPHCNLNVTAELKR